MPNISVSLSGENPNDPITEINCGKSIPRVGGDINISLFPELTGFYCTGLDIKSINISNNKKLERLEIFDNKITTLPSSLIINTGLKYFDCSRNEIGGSIPIIGSNQALQYFNCSGNNFTGFEGNVIDHTLKTFYANNNKLYSPAVDRILNAINSNISTNGILDLSNGNQPPSITSIIVKQILGTSFSRTLNLVTVTFPNHGYSTNDILTIKGMQNTLNGTFKITRVSSSVFTYETLTSGTVTGTGTATITSSNNPNDGFKKYQNLQLPVSQGGKGWNVKISDYFIKQLGSPIQLNGSFGFAVDMNDSGDRIILGIPFYDIYGTLDGTVEVFEWDGENWNIIFNLPIEQKEAAQNGYSVAINGVGDIIAFGSPNKSDGSVIRGSVSVYQESAGTWSLKGLPITGTNGTALNGTDFGSSISLSSIGNTIAIGEPGTTNGTVSIFQFGGINWSQLGADIDGLSSNDRFGESISLHPSLNKIIIGAPNYNNIGMAAVYEYKVVNNNPISWVSNKNFFPTQGSTFGNSVSIRQSNTTSSDIVAIADSNYGKGVVYLYYSKNINNIPVWQEIKESGQLNDDSFGSWVELNKFGNHLVVGAQDSYTNDIGQVRIYKEISETSWQQIGIGVAGLDQGEKFGSCVSINSNGSRIVVGSSGFSQFKAYELLD